MGITQPQCRADSSLPELMLAMSVGICAKTPIWLVCPTSVPDSSWTILSYARTHLQICWATRRQSTMCLAVSVQARSFPSAELLHEAEHIALRDVKSCVSVLLVCALVVFGIFAQGAKAVVWAAEDVTPQPSSANRPPDVRTIPARGAVMCIRQNLMLLISLPSSSMCCFAGLLLKP